MAAQTILLVDNSVERRSTLLHQLEALGYSVTAAKDDRQALDQLAVQRFDLALIAIGLWGMNSYQVLERMQAGGILTHTPAIMLTPSDNTPGIERCMDLVASDYLAEPFLPAVVKARVYGCLAQHSLIEYQQHED